MAKFVIKFRTSVELAVCEGVDNITNFEASITAIVYLKAIFIFKVKCKPMLETVIKARLEAGPEAGLEAELEAGPEAGLEAGPEAGLEAGPEAGPEARHMETKLPDLEPMFEAIIMQNVTAKASIMLMAMATAKP